MRLLWRLAIRNWARRPGRTVAAAGAVALGVALVVAVTACYQSLRVSLAEWVQSWLSRGQLRLQERTPSEQGFPIALAERVRGVPGVRVAAPRLRLYVDLGDGRDTVGTAMFGIDPESDYAVRWFRVVEGRLLDRRDADGLMLAEEVARKLKVRPGDWVTALDGAGRPRQLKLIGTVVQPNLGLWRPVYAYVLLPRLAALRFAEGRLTTLDVALEPWAEASKVQSAIERLVPPEVQVVTTPSQVRPIEEGMRLLGVILVWTSAGALLTAWFMIFATLDLGVVERTRELGILRCVGSSRLQVAGLVLVEALPVAAVGVAVGLPAGLGLARLAAYWFSSLFGRFAVNVPGLYYAALGGLAATVLAAAVPAVAAARVSIIAATRPEARGARTWLRFPLAAGALALLGLLALWVWSVSRWTSGRLMAVVVLAWPVGLAGMVGALPLVTWGAGAALRRPVGWLLRLPNRLLAMHYGRNPWRSALVAGALAMGVSLLVNLLTNTESIIAGWEPPQRFPDAVAFVQTGLDSAMLERVAAVKGVRQVVPVWADEGQLVRADEPAEAVRFLSLDPALVREAIQLNFVAGEPEAAFKAVGRGGAVIVPRALADAHGLAYDSVVQVRGSRGRSARLRVAGIVESAGFNILQVYYEESASFLEALSAAVVIGSVADARGLFGETPARLLLLSLDLPEGLPAAERRKREKAVLDQVRRALPTLRLPLIGEQALYRLFSMTELKGLINRDFRNAILWMAFAGLVACLVAGLGVVNLMMANVAARARPIAILRGVGATRSLITRLIVAEGFILGIVGSAVGLLHGLFMAAISNHLNRAAFGVEPRFSVPWPLVGVGLGTAVVIAVLAATLPGIHAARANIAAALDTA